MDKTYVCVDADGDTVFESTNQQAAINCAKANLHVKEVVVCIDGEPDQSIWSRSAE